MHAPADLTDRDWEEELRRRDVIARLRSAPQSEDAVVREAWAAINSIFPGDPFGDWQDAAFDRFAATGSVNGFPGIWLPPNQKRGEDLPAQNTEQGLTWLRNSSRLLCAASEYAVSALENRVNYILSTGLTYRVAKARKDCPTDVVTQCQSLIELFSAAVDLPGLEAETLMRCDIDGDAFLRLFKGDRGRMEVRFVEPEHVTGMYGGGGSSDRRYSYGIETAPQDAETVLAYHVIENPDQPETTRIDACDILHMKGGRAFRSSKRGRPLFYCVFQNLRRVEQISSGLAAIARARAKIALIRRLKSGSQASADKLKEKVTNVTVADPITGKERSIEQFRDGTILTSSDNIEYEYPAANLGSGDFIEVLNFHLRGIAAAVNMPEWMLTSNASDMGAYTSSLVAEAPSTRGFQRAQQKVRHFFAEGRYGARQSLLWKYLYHCADDGLVDRRELALIDLTAEAPTLTVRDEAQEASTNKTYHDMRVKSVETIQMELGLDPDEENARLSREAPPPQAGPGGMPGEPVGPDRGPTDSQDQPEDQGDTGDSSSPSGDFQLDLSDGVTEAVERVVEARKASSSTFTGVVFGRYFLNGKEVDAATYRASKQARTGASHSPDAHAVKLPKSKRRLSIDQAGAALSAMGYEMGRPSMDGGRTLYPVTFPSGKTGYLTDEQVKEVAYKGAERHAAGPAKQGEPPPLPKRSAGTNSKAPWDMNPEEAKAAGVSYFRTGQGSLYAHANGQTIRVKSPHLGHETKDVGLKRGSEVTHFIDPEDAKDIGMWQSSSAEGKRIVVKGDTAYLVSRNAKTGGYGLDGEIKLHSQPKKGLSPLELNDKSSKGGESIHSSFAGGQVWKGNHPGSPITEFPDHAGAHAEMRAAAGKGGEPEDPIVSAAKQAPETPDNLGGQKLRDLFGIDLKGGSGGPPDTSHDNYDPHAIRRGREWAAGQADRHAAKVATHLGLQSPAARAKLHEAISQAARRAVLNGSGTLAIKGPNGKTIRVTVRYKPRGNGVQEGWGVIGVPGEFSLRLRRGAGERTRVLEAFDPALHPKGSDGRWIKKAAIGAAARSGAVAAKLREKVTDPGERAKLDAAIRTERSAHLARASDLRATKAQQHADEIDAHLRSHGQALAKLGYSRQADAIRAAVIGVQMARDRAGALSAVQKAREVFGEAGRRQKANDRLIAEEIAKDPVFAHLNGSDRRDVERSARGLIADMRQNVYDPDWGDLRSDLSPQNQSGGDGRRMVIDRLKEEIRSLSPDRLAAHMADGLPGETTADSMGLDLGPSVDHDDVAKTQRALKRAGLGVPEVQPGEDSGAYADRVLEDVIAPAHDAVAVALRAAIVRHFGLPQSSVTESWDESKVHRGQPENAGEFAPAGGGGETGDASDQKVSPKKYGKSKADVYYASKIKASREQTDQILKDVLGSDDPEDIASAVGAPDDAKVYIDWKTSSVATVEVKHPAFTAKRYIGRDADGKPFIENAEIWVAKDKQGAGLGAEIFGRQVENAAEAGVSYIVCHAAKDNPRSPDKPHNGYYTWPRFGYDMSLDDSEGIHESDEDTFAAARKRFPDAKTILDVMQTQEGRDWWKANGTDLLNARFDLTPGSRSMQVLGAYQDARAKAKG